MAHPDDESFGPGGTIAKYAREDVEVHLVCASKGERGKIGKYPNTQIPKYPNGKEEVGKIREREVRDAAKVLGIERVEFLDILDGEICNKIYHKLADKIIQKITSFSPQVIITHDRLGVSGHLDHIGVAMITTFSFLKSKTANKLYYHCLPKEQTIGRDYFIYFPGGYEKKDITSIIETQSVWQVKLKAMKKHKSQQKDVNRVINWQQKFAKREYFILKHWYKVKVSFPEDDLFVGIR